MWLDSSNKKKILAGFGWLRLASADFGWLRLASAGLASPSLA
jgi:hypothetical protein